MVLNVVFIRVDFNVRVKKVKKDLRGNFEATRVKEYGTYDRFKDVTKDFEAFLIENILVYAS